MLSRKDPFEDKVKCEECKHWVDKYDCSDVDYNVAHSFMYPIREKLYYCPEHTKPYSRKTDYSCSDTKYFKEIEVDKDGTPLGYKKIK